MENKVCDFCKRGREVENVCGKLHVEKVDGGTKEVAAHHKCMQYSADLLQYKFDNFGGFKIAKVEKEIKRGRLLSCVICKRKPKKGRKNLTGATAGCAIKSCRKTFHFYCAKLDENTITKRFMVRNKTKGADSDVVLYRVFCCDEHKTRFSKDKGNLRTNPKESHSDESDENENESDEHVPEFQQYSCNTQEPEDIMELEESICHVGQEKKTQGKNKKGNLRTTPKESHSDESDDDENENESDEHVLEFQQYNTQEPEDVMELEESICDEGHEKKTQGKNKKAASPPPPPPPPDDSPEEEESEVDEDSESSEEMLLGRQRDEDSEDDFVGTPTSATKKRKTPIANGKETPQRCSPSVQSSLKKTKVEQASGTTKNRNTAKQRLNLSLAAHMSPKNTNVEQATGTDRETVKRSPGFSSAAQTSPRKASVGQGSKTEIRPVADTDSQKKRLSQKSSDSKKSVSSPNAKQKLKSKKDIKSDSCSSSDQDVFDQMLLSQASPKKKNTVVTEAIINNCVASPDKNRQISQNGTAMQDYDDDTDSDITTLQIDDNGNTSDRLTTIQHDDNTNNGARVDIDEIEVITSTEGDPMDDEIVKTSTKRSPRKQSPQKKPEGVRGDKSLRLMSPNKEVKESPRSSPGRKSTSQTNNRKFQESSLRDDVCNTVNYPNCCLVLTQSMHPSPAQRKKLRQRAQEVLGVYHVAFWLDSDQLTELTADYLPHVIGEIASLIQEDNLTQLVEVFTCSKRLTEMLDNFRYVVKLRHTLDSHIVKQMTATIFKNIPQCYEKDDQIVMIKDEEFESLLIKLCPLLDKRGQIRQATCQLSQEKTSVYQWKEKTVAALDPGRSEETELEVSLLLSWLQSKVDEGFQFEVLPKDEILLVDQNSKKEDQITGGLWKLFDDVNGTEVTANINLILRINSMDRAVTNVLEYCRRAIIKACSRDFKNVFFVIDIDPSANEPITRRNLLPKSFVGDASCKLFSAFNPRQKAISYVVVHKHKEAHLKQSPRVDGLEIDNEINHIDLSSDEELSVPGRSPQERKRKENLKESFEHSGRNTSSRKRLRLN